MYCPTAPLKGGSFDILNSRKNRELAPLLGGWGVGKLIAEQLIDYF
jgi:hypothetical protein